MSRRRQPTIYPPSVGELMDRANVLARDLLYEAHERDGRVMLRAWGEVVEGASELWRQLPQRSNLHGTGSHVLDQLERSARTLRRSAGRGIEVDPTLQEIGQMFTQAADLIARSGVIQRYEPSRWTPAQVRDAFAARVNIMHTLYVAAHGVCVGLAKTAGDEKVDCRLQVHSIPADELRYQVHGVEQIAHSYINGHYPQALEARYREPTDDNRIDGAIATWDVYTQRTLNREPTTHAMTRVAGAAFKASVQVHALWRMAVEAGQVDRWTFDTEISPTLDTMIERWGEAHAHFQQLTHPHDTSPPALGEAGWELSYALREVTAHRRTHATAKEDNEQVDGASLVRSLHRFHATMAEIGGVFHEAARNAPLLVDARAANNIMRSASQGEDRWTRPSKHATVAPRDVLHRRAIPLPAGLRGQAGDTGRQAALASRAALRATVTASDGRRDAISLPANCTHHIGSANRLTSSQRYEHVSTAPRMASVISKQVPR